MSLTSRIGAAQDGLLAAINTQAALPANPLAGVTRTLGEPGTLKKEHVWISEDADAEQTWDVTGSGAQAKRETFELQAVVLVVKAGNVYKAARDRALLFAGEIEQAVRADPKLAASVWDAEVVRVEMRSGAVEKARGVELHVIVRASEFLA